MKETYLAISQYSEGSLYRDIVGKVYEFPNKYKGLLTRENIHFIYYEPKKRGNGVYFGTGRIGKVTERPSPEEDEEPSPHQRLFVAEVLDFRKFAHSVPLEREDGSARETVLRNSVREIPRQLFEEIVQLGGEEVSFTADAHLMQVLGEQLIGSEKVGILELIKNAYDAGATKCTVRIEKVPGLHPLRSDSDEWVAAHEGPVISVIDDGCGMDRNTILNGWLRPATTIKTRLKEQLKAERARAQAKGTEVEFDKLVAALKKEHGGRLPIGEKGVGRFAAHRLGRHLLLLTKTADDPLEWVLSIDWDSFNAIDGKSMDLASVGMHLEHRKPTWEYGKKGSGTVLRIYGGRKGFEWDLEKLGDIWRSVALLQSPRRRPWGFDVAFECQHLEDQAQRNPLESAPPPFTCDALVEEDGTAIIEITFDPPPSLRFPMVKQIWKRESINLRVKRSDHWKGKDKKHLRMPSCGPFFVNLKCWIRKKEWIHGADWEEVTTYLDKCGGVDIYRDGLNVVSAQVGSERDWLGLATRHIKKGDRISYYNLSGAIDLCQEKTLDLVDKTSREGLLETRPSKDLSVLVQAITDELQFRVQEIRDKYEKLREQSTPDPEMVKRRTGQVRQLLSKLSTDYDFDTDEADIVPILGKHVPPRDTLAGLAEIVADLRKCLDQLEAQVDGLVEAAGFGLSIGVAVHEIVKVTTNLASTAERLSREVPKDAPYKERVLALCRMSESLLSEARRISPLHVTRLEEKSTFTIREAILAAMGAFQLTWSQQGIEVPTPPKSHDFELTQQFGVCSQVFANLLDNATYWLSGHSPPGGEKRIALDVRPESRTVVIADNGPGIAERIREHLFQPFYSLKSPPSGLGLYVCKHYMHRMKGEIREAGDGERIKGYPGAQFVVEFPKQGDGK